jgi:hypothetical protein
MSLCRPRPIHATRSREQHLDVRRRHAGMLGHDLCCQSKEPLVTLPIILIAREGKARLCQSLYLARPEKPAGLDWACRVIDHPTPFALVPHHLRHIANNPTPKQAAPVQLPHHEVKPVQLQLRFAETDFDAVIHQDLSDGVQRSAKAGKNLDLRAWATCEYDPFLASGWRMDKVRRSIFWSCDYHDPPIDGWIIAAPVAHVSLGNVTGSRKPLGYERMLIWRKQTCRKVANRVLHWLTAFSTRGCDRGAAGRKPCVADCIRCIDVDQRRISQIGATPCPQVGGNARAHWWRLPDRLPEPILPSGLPPFDEL